MSATAGDSRFAVYFSHSWRPADVDLNLQVWLELAETCELLVDAPEEPGADPPYYINRIEELLRRTDLFVSVLTYREPRAGDFTSADANLKCSPYSLFEIRLAERADLPRLILYDRNTLFRPPRAIRPGEAYVPFDRGRKERLPEQRQWTTVTQPKIRQWRDWAVAHRRPTSYEQSQCAVMLLGSPPPAAVRDVVENSLQANGYEPVQCDPARLRGSEALRLLREAGLVVAELSAGGGTDQLYAAAHALQLPAIRMMASAAGAPLPWMLRGDPGGYEHDIVSWASPIDLPPLIEPRIRAMFRLSPALRDDSGSDYLQSKRYSPFFVFISHTLKPPHRAFVEHIFDLLKERHVVPFEYHEVNTAGIDWRQALNESLQKTTHFVALLSPDYEVSQTCTYELETILARGDRVSVLPFMSHGRTVPNPKLAHMHNTLLSNEDPRADAAVVVEQVMRALDGALARAEPV